MSYQVMDTTEGLSQAMKLIKPAMKGMPARQRYMREYNDLRRKIAMLIMSIEDGHNHFHPDGQAAKAQKKADQFMKTAA